MTDILISTDYIDDNSETNLYDLFDSIGYEYYSFENGILIKLDSCRDYFKWKTAQEKSIQAGPGVLLETLGINKTLTFLLFCGLRNTKKQSTDLFYLQSNGGRFDGFAKFYGNYNEAIEDFNQIRDYHA